MEKNDELKKELKKEPESKEIDISKEMALLEEWAEKQKGENDGKT